MMFNALGYEVAHVGFSQWNGVRSCPGSASRTSEIGFRSAVLGRGHRDRGTAMLVPRGGARVELYVPTAARWTPLHLQYKLDWLPRCGRRRRLADRRPAAAGGARRRLEHRPAGRRRVGHERLHPLDARLRARARGVPGDRRGRVRRRRPTARARSRRLHVLGLRAAAVPRREGMRIDSRSAPPHSPPRTAALIDREERKGKGASDHAPW